MGRNTETKPKGELPHPSLAKSIPSTAPQEASVVQLMSKGITRRKAVCITLVDLSGDDRLYHRPIDSTSNFLFLLISAFAQQRSKYFTTLQTGTWHTFLSALVECRGDGSYSLEATLEPPYLLALHARDGRHLR
jgi:hypothetical protein